MKLRPYGNIVKCNCCNERFAAYNDIFRCPWCSYYGFVDLASTSGRFVYPPTLLDIDTVTRLPYYPGDMQ